MNILHLISSLDPAGGGPPVVAMRLAAAQARLGHQVSLVSYRPIDDDADRRIQKELSDVPGVDGVSRHWLPRGGRLERILLRHGRPILRRLLGSTDIVHMHGVWDPLLLVAASAARRARVPYVVMPHGMLDVWCLNQKRLKKKLALALAYRHMLAGASFVHALNRDEAAAIDLLRLGVPNRIIPNGVFAEEFDALPPSGTFYQRHPQLGERPFILFLSRLHYKKGLDYLAEAFAELRRARPDVQLVVAGPDDGYKAEFERLVAQHSVSSHVHVIGPIYGEEKFAALVDAACFCLPSRQEGFSIAITEALACATPVVVSDQCHYPEVADAGAGMVVPLDAASTAAALQQILADATRAKAMGEAGRKLVYDRFTWPAIAARALDAYVESLRPSDSDQHRRNLSAAHPS